MRRSQTQTGVYIFTAITVLLLTQTYVDSHGRHEYHSPTLRPRINRARFLIAACLAAGLALSCAGHTTPLTPSANSLTLSVVLTVSNVKFGTAVRSDFVITVAQPAHEVTATEGDDGPVVVAVPAGAAYTVSVSGPAGYATTASPDCAGTASVGRKACAIELKEAPVTCDDTLWNRIYLRDRLHLLNQCQAASGIVVDLGLEPDGDLVMELIPDSPYTSLLRPGNNSADAHGHLVVEVPCQGATMEDSPRAACAHFTGTKVQVPKLGDHIVAAAPWVEDLNHSRWGELHGARLIALPR
jgi:hypothetical protein